jgi:hypothetical protein
MKQKRVLLTLIALVLTSLTCTLPFSTPSEPSQVEIDELNAMITADIELGGMSEQDINADGVTDNIYYTFPSYELQEGVFLTKTYAMESGGKDDFYPGIIVAFNNESGMEQAFKFILGIPKEFASDAADLSFSLEPSEIIEPDPILSFNVSIKPEQQVDQLLTVYSVAGLGDTDLPRAKQVLMETAFAEAIEHCKNTWFPQEHQQSACYLNLIIDFKDFIPKGGLEGYCDLAGASGRPICFAILDNDISYCTKLKDIKENERCKAYFIDNLCAKKKGEDKVICIGQYAIEHKCASSCMTIPDDDLKNYCLARVTNARSYCDDITNYDLKATCLADIKQGDRNVIGGILDLVAGTFSSGNAEKNCKSFSALAATYPVIKAKGSNSFLTCEYYSSEAESSYNVQLHMAIYTTADEAMAKWNDTNDPKKLPVGISTSDLVEKKQTNTNYIFIQRKTSTGDTTLYQVDAGELIGRAYIYYQERFIHSADTSRWVATLAQAKHLLGE